MYQPQRALVQEREKARGELPRSAVSMENAGVHPFQSFRGREPTTDALLRHSGLRPV